MTREAEVGPKRKERSLRAKKIIFGFWVAGVLVVIGLIFVAPISLKAYDAGHPVAIHCTVTSASSSAGSSRSVRGNRATYNQVRIDSPDCGVLFLRESVTAANASDVADGYSSGRRYEFEIGAASYRFRDQLRFVHQSVEVRPVSE